MGAGSPVRPDEEATADSTGVLALYSGRILDATGKTDRALEALSSFRRGYPDSPHRREGLVLEAGLRGRSGSPREAARLYHLALLEPNSGTSDAAILALLAELSIGGLADTVSAVRYWEMVVREDRDGPLAEEALWHAGGARERIGDGQELRAVHAHPEAVVVAASHSQVERALAEAVVRLDHEAPLGQRLDELLLHPSSKASAGRDAYTGLPGAPGVAGGLVEGRRRSGPIAP